MKIHKVLLTVFIIIALLLSVGCSDKQTESKYTKENPMVLKFVLDNPVGHIKTQAAQKFADLVYERSKGTIKVELYPSGQLYSELEAVDAIQANVVNFVAIYAGKLGGHAPNVQAMCFPFIFNDAQDFYKFADSALAKEIMSSLKKIDLEPLAVWDQGFAHYMNAKRPIKGVEDFKGIKFRIAGGQAASKALGALGATAITLAPAELYTALQQGAVDGIEISASNIKAYKWYEVSKYLSISHSLPSPNILLTNKTWWEGLPAETRKMMEETIKEVTAFEREGSVALDVADIDFLKKETKLIVNEISAENKDKLREVVKPVYQEFENVVGKEVLARVLAKDY